MYQTSINWNGLEISDRQGKTEWTDLFSPNN